MNKMEKNSIYDELCRTLTEYEEQLKIQNKWEELTGEEE